MKRIMKHIMMSKEHLMQLGFVLFFAIVIVTILLSSGASSTDNNAQDGNNTLNITYVDCIINSSMIKDSCYNISRTTAYDCRVNALNETSRDKTQIKKCSTDFIKDMENCKLDATNAFKDCRKIEHTFFDELETARYE